MIENGEMDGCLVRWLLGEQRDDADGKEAVVSVLVQRVWTQLPHPTPPPVPEVSLCALCPSTALLYSPAGRGGGRLGSCIKCKGHNCHY